MALRQDLHSILTSWRHLSPVDVGVRPEVKYLLMRRYASTVARNTKFSLVLLAVVLAGFGHEAPPPILAAIWGATALLYGAREFGRRRSLHSMQAERDAGRQGVSPAWHTVLPGISTVVWAAAPLILQSWISPTNLLCMVSAAIGVLAMISVSYVAALPACAIFLAGNGVLIIVLLAMQQTEATFLLAGLAALAIATVLVRVIEHHRTLVQALTSELEKAALVRELQAHRDALSSENQQLGLSLLNAASAAQHDPLTGLHNRRYINEVLPPLRDRVARRIENVALCVVDIDHFKKINDRYGHPIGDEVLRAMGQTLEGRLRAGDCLARMGGEEFLAVLRNCDLRSARRVGEAIRSKVAELPFVTTSGDIVVTVSIGTASWRAVEAFEDVFARADRALYQAKEGGRNRVVTDGLTGAEAADSRPVSTLH